MKVTTKAAKSFSLDRDILAEVKRTKGAASESERVNALLRCALDLEKRAALEREAADFFARVPKDRKERRAFQKASVSSLARE